MLQRPKSEEDSDFAWARYYDLIFFKLSTLLLLLFKWTKHGLFFIYFSLFAVQFGILEISRQQIRTKNVKVEGEDADHYSTTTAPLLSLLTFIELRLLRKIKD